MKGYDPHIMVLERIASEPDVLASPGTAESNFTAMSK